MNSTSVKRLYLTVPAVYALVTVAALFVTGSVRGAQPAQIVVQGPAKHTVVGYEWLRPIQQTTVTVGVSYDPITLTTRSGVALLRDAVAQAAFKACSDADPSYAPASSCISSAIDQAEPQIVQAVARARSGVYG